MKKIAVLFRYMPVIFLIIWTMDSFAQNTDPRMWSIHFPKDAQFFEVPKSHLGYVHRNHTPMVFHLTNEDATVSPNVRVHPSNFSQSEVPMTRGSNPNILFGSANTYNPGAGFFSEGVYVTTNGGTTWFGSDTCKAAPITDHGGDPGPGVGPDGRLYMSYLPGSYNSIKAAYSTNYGSTWSTGAVLESGSMDKNLTAVDNVSGSPYLGRAYVTWSDFSQPSPPVAVSYTTNGGVNWSTFQDINTPASGHYCQGVNPVVGPGGIVYIAYANPITSGSYTEDYVGLAKSTNGGATWTFSNNIYDENGIRGYLNFSGGSQIRVNGFPWMAVDNSGGSRNGWIYIVTGEKSLAPAGSDADIVMHVSTNGGTSWSAGIRVNQDAMNNGQYQYMPAVCVGADGSVNVVYYDTRNAVLSGGTPDSAQVYISRSTDGGTTFQDILVSDHSFKPKPISGLATGYQGDYIGIVESNGKVFPYWCDDITGLYQAWTAKVTFGPPCPVNTPTNPNPANGAVNVSASLSQLSWTNGSGATRCEVWYGTSGNMSKVYDGNLISTYNLNPPLNYYTVYNWQIVDKNDTCDATGAVWSFRTETSPAIIYIEPFTNMDCWTPIGPMGTTNWSVQNSSNAGGTPPELVLNWSPQFDGLSKLVSCVIPVQSNHNYSVSLTHMIDWYANTAPTLGIGVSYDNGSTYTPVWSITPTANVGPETVTGSFTTPLSGTNLYLVLFCNGNSFNIDYWYVDDITLTDDQFLIVNDPTGVTATPISSQQIDVGFTPNSNNNNVLVAWNLTGVFTAPSGTPPALGQPFAGGTLLYNGITSPVHHTGLNALTTYYYKLFSYNGTSYSAGVTANAQTLQSLDFAVSIAVTDNCANSSHQLIFGTAAAATDCFDAQFDLSAPPPPPVGVIDGRFSSCSEDFFTDIRQTNTSGERIWDMHYQPNEGCSPVTLTWNPAQLPVNGYFHLVDLIFGTMVNINMRGVNHYTDALGLGHLLIKYNYQIQASFHFTQGWNMLSLPVDVANHYYHTLFPDAVTGTLYGYSGSYIATDSVKNSKGYWLKFPATETVVVNGSDRTQCVIPLSSGWNMIGGPDCNVPISSVIDPGGIIIPGTLYGYSGSYVTSSSIDATKGYWIKTNSAGTITISCGSGLAENSRNLTIPPQTFSDFTKIDVGDAIGNSETLYFNGKLDESTSIESFSMPPVPPPGSFDVRLTDGYRLSEGDEASIQLQSANYPISVTINCPDKVVSADYVLQEIANGVIAGTHKIVDGEKIVISNQQTSLLKISRAEALPTSYNLAQNYPNPFNPVTTIEFSLPEKAQNVKLTIYSLLGEKITELVNTSLEAGRYSYQWDGKNVATGIYIYELKTEKFVSVKKMLLMK